MAIVGTDGDRSVLLKFVVFGVRMKNSSCLYRFTKYYYMWTWRGNGRMKGNQGFHMHRGRYLCIVIAVFISWGSFPCHCHFNFCLRGHCPHPHALLALSTQWPPSTHPHWPCYITIYQGSIDHCCCHWHVGFGVTVSAVVVVMWCVVWF